MDNNEEYRLGKLRELQLEELKLIRLFVDICDKEKLTYYLICGTLLGAVRHKGFIPWDDDVDIAMPRPDYDRFLQVAEKYFPEGIKLVAHGKPDWNEVDHKSYISKMENLNYLVESNACSKRITRGAWIDIDPLDAIPNGKCQYLLHRFHLLLLRKLYTIANFEETVALENEHRSWYNRIGVFLCAHLPIQKMFSIEKRWQAIDRALKKYSYDSCDRIVNMMGAYKFREMFPKEVFGEGAFYEFEGMRLRGPKDYDTYLKQLYGDYMTPPPESQRNWHGTEFFENEAEKVDWKTQ